jgi:subtilisin family serine protease
MLTKVYRVILIVSVLNLLSSYFSETQAQVESVTSISSLDSKSLNWYNKSPEMDKIQGAEVNRCYSELLVNRMPKKFIVVAVIDGGVDVDHEDLKGKIWVNKREIPNNGIDDDLNGYIDDVNGWNFLGNSKGVNIKEENSEATRLLKKFKPLYDTVSNKESLPEIKRDEFVLYVAAKNYHFKKVEEYKQMLRDLENFERNFTQADEFIKNYLGKSDYTIGDLYGIRSKDQGLMKLRDSMINLFRSGFSKQKLAKSKEDLLTKINKNYNTDFNPRKNIIADNITDINDKNYGNNNVKGPDPYHGTAVAGVVAASRNNGIGIDGIADSVKIMVIRAVPDGDEYDKDIALAIRYAVDNGANIINMSFGKNFSPEKIFVDDAIKYAESKNVLLVHAAGNDSDNIDVVNSYPANLLNDSSKVNSWIKVGANGRKLNKMLSARFSNYGSENVDIFAPGVQLAMLYPNNKYSIMDGTSFAAPVVSGVAALIWSYYPDLSSIELKDIILKSCTDHRNVKVYYPKQTGRAKKTKFMYLSKTGGIVNAYNAMKLAEKLSAEKLANGSN